MSTNAQARTPALLHRTTQTYRCVLTEHLQALISCSDLVLLLSAPVRVPGRRCRSLGAVGRGSACPRGWGFLLCAAIQVPGKRRAVGAAKRSSEAFRGMQTPAATEQPSREPGRSEPPKTQRTVRERDCLGTNNAER
ncbi:hypothetical protein AAFF_G00029430 [Aldrovandia affinis]|uniref:Uncharacterized protein n=1 Tax=Aldrovandia affinis TaxID=143900 RepID=A0AAD7S6J3_9TELE|nr:hypothetical protein AAFF_G00029430 [Aldrovandia affinis]